MALPADLRRSPAWFPGGCRENFRPTAGKRAGAAHPQAARRRFGISLFFVTFVRLLLAKEVRNEVIGKAYRLTAGAARAAPAADRDRLPRQPRRRRRRFVARLGRGAAGTGPRGDVHRAEQIPLFPRLDAGHRRGRGLQDRRRRARGEGRGRGGCDLLPRFQRRLASRS